MKSFLKKRIGRSTTPATPLEILSRPGGHERRLRALYGEDAAYLETGPVFDKPLVIVGFTNRSGSNLLVDYVRQAGRANGGGEYLNGDVLETLHAQHGFKRFPGYLLFLYKTQCKPGQSLMLKASWDQLAMLVRLNIPAVQRRVQQRTGCLDRHPVAGAIGAAGLQRQQVKQILDGWEKNSPGRRQVMFKALTNVRPSHMMDSKLFDFAGLMRDMTKRAPDADDGIPDLR